MHQVRTQKERQLQRSRWHACIVELLCSNTTSAVLSSFLSSEVVLWISLCTSCNSGHCPLFRELTVLIQCTLYNACMRCHYSFCHYLYTSFNIVHCNYGDLLEQIIFLYPPTCMWIRSCITVIDSTSESLAISIIIPFRTPGVVLMHVYS